MQDICIKWTNDSLWSDHLNPTEGWPSMCVSTLHSQCERKSNSKFVDPLLLSCTLLSHHAGLLQTYDTDTLKLWTPQSREIICALQLQPIESLFVFYLLCYVLPMLIMSGLFACLYAHTHTSLVPLGLTHQFRRLCGTKYVILEFLNIFGMRSFMCKTWDFSPMSVSW